MASDKPFYELATRFPETALALALAGLRPAGPYQAESPCVKRERRIDVVLRPTQPGAGPSVYLELQDRPDPTVERRLLEALVMDCLKEDTFEPVRAVILYTRKRYLKAALSADVRDGRQSVLAFRPTRILLPARPCEVLESHGGALLVGLPLVGSTREVRKRAPTWYRSIRRSEALAEADRAVAIELFVRLLAERLGTIDVEGLLGEGERAVEQTVTGQRLIEKGFERGVEKGIVRGVRRLLETRFGPLPRELTARLEALHDPALLEELVSRAALVASLVEFERALPPAG